MKYLITFLGVLFLVNCSDDSTSTNQNGKVDQGSSESNQTDGGSSDVASNDTDTDGPECTADGICACESLPVDRCSDFSDCYPMDAYEVVAGSDCTTKVNVTCAPEQNCDNNIYYREDSEGNCFVFPGGCFPPKRFTESERCNALAQETCGL